jgi:DNA-binding MarR family transcriptional regulator
MSMRYAYIFCCMNDLRTANIFGALALALADGLLEAAQSRAPEAGPAASAIALLGHEPGMPIERLRKALGLSHPGAVRLVDRLEREGAVVRRQSKQDRRAVALDLTGKGVHASEEIRSARYHALRKALTVLTPSERKTLGKLTEKMLRAVLQDEDHAYAMCRLCDATACTTCPVEAELNARGP